MTFDQRQFRDAVGCFATGVTIVTTLDHDGNKVGITANSFTSLSLDPPLVLFCVDSRINSFASPGCLPSGLSSSSTFSPSSPSVLLPSSHTLSN